MHLICAKRRAYRLCGAASRRLVPFLLLVCFAAGCEDNRISLNQFLELQQKMRQVGSTTQPSSTQPSTQPSASQPVASESVDRHLGPYRVGPGDVLTLTLTTSAQPALTPPVQVRVDRMGEIELPLVGKIKLAGLELEDVERVVQQAHVPKIYKDLVVHAELFAPDNTNVLVTGAVTNPGLVQLKRTQRNLLFAIVGAGGVSNMASGSVTLRRIRRPNESVTLDLLDPDQLKTALALAPLEHGDMVTVQAAVPNTIFVGGLVTAPRPQTYPPGVRMTILQAIAASGGLRTDVTPTEATLIRRMPDGRDVHVKLELDRLVKGKDPNIDLAAGDILWVPETFATKVQDWVNKNIFFRAGFVATANVSYDASALEYMNTNAKMAQQGYSGNLQDQFDPFGFITRSNLMQSIVNRSTAVTP